MVRGSTLGLLVLALLAVSASADDKDNPLNAYAKAGQPGPEHKILHVFAGEWSYTAKMWIKPEGEPIKMTGSVVRKLIFGGRFVQDTVQNEKPNSDFKGLGLLGYDKLRKKYTSVWIDNMSTAVHTSLGTLDKDGKVFTFEGTNIDPITGKTIKGRAVIRLDGKNKIVMEESREEGGKWVKAMEITYTRKEK